MAKVSGLIGEQQIGIPIQITVSAKLTFLGKIGLVIMKLGAWIMGIAAIKIKEIEKEEEEKKGEKVSDDI